MPMTLSLEWLRALIHLYPSFEYLIIFLGAAFGGELALFTVAFLGAQGILQVFPLIVFSFLGAFSADILWFFLGKTTLAGKLIFHRYTSPAIAVIAEAINRVSR